MTIALHDFTVHMAFGGSYVDAVLPGVPLGVWLMNEFVPITGARDLSGHGRHGTYEGGIIASSLGKTSFFPQGGTHPHFEAGTSDYVDTGNVAALRPTGAVTFEAIFIADTVATALQYIGGAGIGDDDVFTSTGYRLVLSQDDLIFSVNNTHAQATAAIVEGQVYHAVGTYDGANVRLYLDGVLVAGPTALTGAIDYTGVTTFRIAQLEDLTAGRYFDGSISGVAVYGSAMSAASASVHYHALQWTDVTADVVVDQQGLSLEYGTSSIGPLDRLANAGTLQFSLDNSAYNSAGLVGYYSPLHDNCRSGFTFDVPVRVSFIQDAIARVKFWGRVQVINPEPGVDAHRVTRIVAHDYMYQLIDADLRSITPKVGDADITLILYVLEALGPSTQPMSVQYDNFLEQYAYAFDDIKGGVKAATAIQKVLLSGWSRAYVLGNGTFRWLNRLATTNQIIDWDIDASAILEVDIPSDRGDVFDHVRSVTHPKAIDATATSILFQHPADSAEKPFVVANGGTLVIWATYRNPANDQMTVGGIDMVTPASGTDFVANSAADGSGSNITANVTVTADYFASTVKLTLTNNHATLGAYFTTLQTRGRGVYDLAPMTSEAIGVPGNRPITVDHPYQTDGQVGQDLANLILNERQAISDPVHRVVVDPHISQDMMELALNGEPGLLVTVTETQTGLNEAQAAIRSVRLELAEGGILTADIGLLPLVVGYQWILDDPFFSILDETTVFG